MSIQILPTGSCRSQAILNLESEYIKRLKGIWQFSVRELKSSPATNPAQASREEATHQLAALSKLPPGALPVLLHEHAKPMDTMTFAKKLAGWLEQGRTPVFLIGGAAGFDDAVLATVPERLSLSPLTFPHQLCRALLAEQIYRAQTIATGHPYHRP
jgi:23S rRNA (pseudouridine1915-N3)-methyltransferase